MRTFVLASRVESPGNLQVFLEAAAAAGERMRPYGSVLNVTPNDGFGAA